MFLASHSQNFARLIRSSVATSVASGDVSFLYCNDGQCIIASQCRFDFGQFAFALCSFVARVQPRKDVFEGKFRCRSFCRFQGWPRALEGLHVVYFQLNVRIAVWQVWIFPFPIKFEKLT